MSPEPRRGAEVYCSCRPPELQNAERLLWDFSTMTLKINCLPNLNSLFIHNTTKAIQYTCWATPRQLLAVSSKAVCTASSREHALSERASGGLLTDVRLLFVSYVYAKLINVISLFSSNSWQESK